MLTAPSRLRSTASYSIASKKDPDARFQAAQDIAFALDALSQPSQPVPVFTNALPKRQRWRSWLKWPALAALILGLIGGALLGHRFSKQPEKVFHRLTFRRGRVQAARFTPDGNGVVYSAQWEGEPSALYSGRFDSPGSTPLDSPPAELFAISPSGELAVKENPESTSTAFYSAGTLARMPLSGGAPRALESRITFADWSPQGSDMAVVRETDRGQQIEYPIGTILYRTAGAISAPRISSSGDQIAFLEHRLANDDGGIVAVVDRGGHHKALTDYFDSSTGLVWSPNGKEIWFSAAENGARCKLWAVTLDGHRRLLYSAPTNLVLHDVSRDGHVLVASEDDRSTLWFHSAGSTSNRELSWLDWSVLSDISQDGKMVAFTESGEGAGAGPVSYLRDTNGAPAVALGQSRYPTFSSDGQFVVAVNTSSLMLYPVGPGESNRIPLPGFTIRIAGLMPDGKRIWFNGSEGSRGLRFYLTDVTGAKPRPITPEGIRHASPRLLLNGKYIAGLSQSGLRLYPVESGDPIIIHLKAGELVSIAGDGGDGHTLFLATATIPSKVYRYDVKAGGMELITEAAPSDQAGVLGAVVLEMTPDGKSYAYSYPQELSELEWVQGIK